MADVAPPCRRHDLLHRLRGGYSPPTSHVDSKKKRKKKKTTKPKHHDGKKTESSSSSSSQPSPTEQQQADTTTTTTNHGDGDAADGTKPSSSSSSSSTTTTASQQQQEQQQQLPPAVQSILEQTCHYDVLGITKAASQVEIQKAYRRRCILTHPDKIRGGERSAFDKVSEAYDVLSCEKKRAVYDRYGKEGLEKGVSSSSAAGSSNGMDFRFGTAGTSFFGNDLFREFFGQQQQQQSTSSSTTSAFRWAHPQPPPPPRNRDLRYQLEVSLEELYIGSTKHVAIQQPNPVRPYFPYRKELEVSLPRGIQNGQSVRLSGVVDSVSEAPPADVIFLIRERRHPIFTRRGHDLAMEIKISLSEAIVGYRRNITCLDGRTIVIGSPYVRKVVQKMEVVDVPSLPFEGTNDGDDNLNTDAANENSTEFADQQQQLLHPPILPPPQQQAMKSTILSYDLPPSILQTGDVHVLKGYGMPKRGGHHHDDQYGDLYIQYVVEMPFGSSSSSSSTTSLATSASNINAANNLSPEERVELARLLCKLEGRSDDPAKDIVHSGSVHDEEGGGGEGAMNNDQVHHLAMASASDFGHSNTVYDDHDEHLRHDDDDEEDDSRRGIHHHHQDVSDFFRRAFTAGRSSSPFGFGGASSGTAYFSSGSSSATAGRGFGGEEEEDHKVECNQM